MIGTPHAVPRGSAGPRTHCDEGRHREARSRLGAPARRRREARERRQMLGELAALMARNPFVDP
jgi:hypothetical protein